MKRAAVVIGVDKTGQLPRLNDAAKGAKRFAVWAQSQGVDPVKVVTDQNDRVTLQMIKDAVIEIVDCGTIEQLIVYFAGHGVNIRYGECWLLSDAPRDTQAAVNVAGSATLARYCGIPHVVFVSDACRTAAEGIQAQGVIGGEIFPNEGGAGLEMPVDQFFACTLGRPAHEIKDPNVTSSEYQAIYTGVLLDALCGRPDTLIEWVNDETGFVRPRPLKEQLYDEVTQKIGRANLQSKIIQIPDARITSGPTAWLAKLNRTEVKPDRRTKGGPRPRIVVPETAVVFSQTLIDSALAGESPASVAAAVERHTSPARGREFAGTFAQTAAPFDAAPGGDGLECRFAVRGALFVQAFASAAEMVAPRPPGPVLSTQVTDGPSASVLLTFDNGTSTVLPAIPGFTCSLTFEHGELVDVGYEPSINTGRWHEFEHRADELRTLRALAAASTRDGVFRLQGDNALQLAQRMQYAKMIDPAMAIYAAYAYHDLMRKDLIRDMIGFLHADLQAVFFDLALLAGDLRSEMVGRDPQIMGCAPLLSQGWSQLSAYRVGFPAQGLQGALLDSPWTLFNNDGAELVRHSIAEGVVR